MESEKYIYSEVEVSQLCSKASQHPIGSLGLREIPSTLDQEVIHTIPYLG
jgi:hypothetical protein